MDSSATWPGRLLQVGAAVFVVALAYSTVLAPPTLVLHAFQALVYLPIIPLARRNRPWLFGAAFMLAAAWNAANLFVTGFIRAGLETLAGIPVVPANPGYVPVVIGACGHFLMIIGLLVAFLRGRPGARSWGGFAAGALLGVLAMAAVTPLRMRLHRRPLPLDVPDRVMVTSAVKYGGGLNRACGIGFSTLDGSAAYAGISRWFLNAWGCRSPLRHFRRSSKPCSSHSRASFSGGRPRNDRNLGGQRLRKLGMILGTTPVTRIGALPLMSTINVISGVIGGFTRRTWT